MSKKNKNKQVFIKVGDVVRLIGDYIHNPPMTVIEVNDNLVKVYYFDTNLYLQAVTIEDHLLEIVIL